MRPVLLFILFISCAVMAEAAGSFPGGDKKKKKKEADKSQTSALTAEQRSKLDRLFLDAEKAKILEDWETAIKDYKSVIETDASNANAHFQLAQIYANQTNLKEAEKEALEAIRLDGNNKWYLETLADIYMSEGKAKEAQSTFETLLKKFPANPDYYLNLGFLYSKMGQYENAIKVYDQFEKNFGIDEQVIQEKKNLYLRLNKFNEAANEVHKLTDAYPNDPQYMLMEADLYKAKGDKEKAKEIYDRVLKLDPGNPQAQLGLAQMNMSTNSDLQKKENLKEIFENPKVSIDTKVSILLISFIQMNSGDSSKRKEAIDLANILTRVHPDEAKAFAVQGDLYYLDEQNDKALQSYQKALTLSKDVFQVWQQVMVIYNLKQDWKKVLETADEAMGLFPNQAMIYFFKGGAEMQLKEFDKAVRSFSKGEKMSADDTKLRAQFLANMGDAYHSLNDNSASDSAYERALKLDPENAYVLNNYSYYLSVRKENLDKAKQMSAYATKLDPNNDSFLDTYAWILFQMGKYADAKEWQEKALKAGGEKSATILEHYGDILFKLGNKTQAMEYWKKAKEAGSDSATLERKIAEQKYLE